MVVRQGDIWWADLGEPIGSAPGYFHPVVVVQGDFLNVTELDTVIVVVVTSQMRFAKFSWNVPIFGKHTGLKKDSIANVSQVAAIDRRQLEERVGNVSQKQLQAIFQGIDVVLGRRRP
jgi:mRNA interferase MazF